MRELRNTKIIAVDHGYGNMKTANTVTPTGIKAYETEPLFCIIRHENSEVLVKLEAKDGMGSSQRARPRLRY